MQDKLYEKVLEILKDNPESRNSDIRLTMDVWIRYHDSRLFEHDEKRAVYLKDLYDLPREDHVKRIRAKIQNDEKKYPPTQWEIAKRRGFLEDEWRVLMGYASKGFEKEEAIETAQQKKHIQQDFNLNDVKRRWK